MIFFTRIRNTCKDNNLIFTERSLSSNAVTFIQDLYDKNQINELENKILKERNQNFDKILDAHILLKTSPEKCLQRIKERARAGEENIDLEFLCRFDILC